MKGACVRYLCVCLRRNRYRSLEIFALVLVVESFYSFRWVEELGLGTLPEMVFGHNFASFEHVESGFEIHFNAREAIDLVDKEHSSVEVGYADHWKNSKM